MSTQSRTSDPPEQSPQGQPQTNTPAAAEGTNLLQRWVRLVQQSALCGNETGQVRLDELAQGPNTPKIQTLEEIRAARTAAVAQEEAESAAGDAQRTSWWDDAVCTDDDEAAGVEQPPVCALEPERAELPPYFTLPPLVAPPVLPAVGEGLLSRILTFGARWLGPVVLGMWPKDTAPPELTDQPYTGMDPEVWPEAAPKPQDDNKCKAKKVMHRGGDEIHNQCADSVPGNAASGGDWLVTTPEGEEKNFDAYTPANNTVWEVKTTRLSTYPKFLWAKEMSDQVAEADADNKVASRCGYRYAFQVSDLEHYRALVPLLNPLGVEVVLEPECLRTQEEP